MLRLESRLDTWVDEGLISPEQAAAIRRREEAERTGGGRIPRVAEAAGYLGAALAIVGGGILLEDFWASLTVVSLLILAATITAALVAAGAMLRGATEPAFQRLASLLWFVSTGGMALVAGLFGDEFTDLAGRHVSLLVGAAVSTHAGVLWRLRPRPLQQIALFAGAVTTVEGLVFLPAQDPPVFFAGLAVWGLGVAWALLGWGEVVRPAGVALVLGAVAILVGAQMSSFGDLRGAGLVLGLATAGGLMAAAVTVSSTLVLAFGAAGVLIFTPQAVFHFLGDTLGAPVALVISGFALIGGALLAVRMRHEVAATGEEG